MHRVAWRNQEAPPGYAAARRMDLRIFSGLKGLVR
jgi:hypothetical protein